ncbi:MAG: MBL fold metallo-hydrolase [Proteobacteria bacterium]|nr:MBL fold metallo-hydrolase [Pseudomonadota bacterium]
MHIATAENWYETESRPDGVTHIGEPHIKEFYRCNIWHVRGRDRDLLIDSGMGVVPLRTNIPLLTGRPILAVASHSHFDHIGGHHEFEERLAHPAEADLLAAPTRKATLADPYVTDDIFTALPPAPYTSTEYAVKAAPATRLVKDGDVIDLGDRVFEVIHTPGHSPGGIALWEAATGILFSGDIVYDGPLVEDAYHSDGEDYIASMERLLHLPVRVVHGGHFPSYDGARHHAIIRAWLTEKAL